MQSQAGRDAQYAKRGIYGRPRVVKELWEGAKQNRPLQRRIIYSIGLCFRSVILLTG